MSIQWCVLASGSAGNCTAVRTPGGVMLVDAGIGPRTVSRRLDGTGVALRDVAAICLTHLDRDHFSPAWTCTILARGIRVFCHADRLDELLDLTEGRIREHVIPFTSAFEPIDGLSITSIPLAHDRHGSCGFLLEGFGCRAGYASDLGRVSAELIERFVNLDLLALESNYDPRMQLDSGRPWFLKQRIMGGFGHLSNEQAFAAVSAILDRSRRVPAHVVLLHRSRQCNCPMVVRKLFTRDARIAGRLTLAEQGERSPWLCPSPLRPLVGEQLALAWG